MSDSRIQSRQLLGEGKWLQLEQLTWTQKDGALHNWETVTRQGARACVMMIATLKPSNRLILVQQFRPPLDRYCIEFPAGLVDDNESFEDAALRELREETGYVGKILRIISPRASSSGLSSERIAMAIVEVDETLPENIHPTPALEASEDLKTLLLDRSNTSSIINPPDGVDVDAKLTAFLLTSFYEFF